MPEIKLVDYEDCKHDPYSFHVTEYPDGRVTMDTETMQIAILLDIRDLLYQVVDHKKDADNKIKTIEAAVNKLSDEVKQRIILFDGDKE